MNKSAIHENNEHNELLRKYVGALSSPEQGNRIEAIRGLTELADIRSTEPLIVSLSSDDPSWSLIQVQGLVLNAIRELGDRAVPEVSRLLQSGNDPIRRTTVWILGELGNPKAIPALMHALQDQNAEVRFNALYSIAQIDPSQAIEPAIAALRDPDSLVRYNGAGILHDFGDERAVEPLIAALNDVDADVRYNAAMALGRIGDERAIPALMLSTKDETELVSGHIVKDIALEAIESIRARSKQSTT